MEIHGIQWKSMETYGNLWNPMEIHGIRWKSMEFYGNLRNPVEFRIQLIGTQTKSELRHNRNSDKIGTQTKSGHTENNSGLGKKKVSGLAPIFIISKP